MLHNIIKKRKLLSDEEALINFILFDVHSISKTIFKTINYDKLIKIASSQLMLPAIYINLKRKFLLKNLPADLINFLEEIYEINKNRNKALLKEIYEISTLLNLNNIDYAFTKGAAILIGGYLKDIGERMVGDIDIIVHKKDIKKTSKLLKNNNYYQKSNIQEFNHRHLPRFLNKKKIFAVEIHKSLIKDNYSKLMPTNEILKNKIINSKNAPFIGDEDLFKNIIYAFQINDLGFNRYFYNIKCSYDINSIIEKNKQRIDFKIINLKFIKEFLIIHDLILKKSIVKNIKTKELIYRNRFIICKKYMFFKKFNYLIMDTYLFIKNYKYKLFQYFTDLSFRNYFNRKILRKFKFRFWQ